MFNVRQPFFNVDGASVGGDTSGDWMSMAQSVMQPEEAPVDDVQPEGDTDAEALKPEEVSEHAVEPDTDEQVPEKTEEPLFNDETEVDLGEGRQAVKLAELKQGYLRQSDYTKKTQQLADERKTFEAERAEWAPVKGMSDFLNSNPWLANQINQFVQEFSQTGSISLEDALQDVQYGQYINSLLAQNNQLKRELDSVNVKYGELEFTGTMRDLKSDLKQEYGDLATDEYLGQIEQRAKDDKLPMNVLKEIAEAHLSKKKLEQAQKAAKTASKKAEADTIKTLQEQRKAMPPQPGSHAQVPGAEKPHADMSWFEMAKLAAQAK